MAGLAGEGAAQGKRLDRKLRHQGEQGAIAAPPGPAIAPAQPEQRPVRPHRIRSSGLQRRDSFGTPRTEAFQTAPDPGLVVRSHRIGHPLHGHWAGGHRSEEVDHLQPPEPPAAAVGHQPPQGGVVPLAISTRGIEPDKHQGRLLRFPCALEPPAVTTAGAEDRRRLSAWGRWGNLWQAVATDGIQGAGDHGQKQGGEAGRFSAVGSG